MIGGMGDGSAVTPSEGSEDEWFRCLLKAYLRQGRRYERENILLPIRLISPVGSKKQNIQLLKIFFSQKYLSFHRPADMPPMKYQHCAMSHYCNEPN